MKTETRTARTAAKTALKAFYAALKAEAAPVVADLKSLGMTGITVDVCGDDDLFNPVVRVDFVAPADMDDDTYIATMKGLERRHRNIVETDDGMLWIN